jgi:hypothetical protein
MANCGQSSSVNALPHEVVKFPANAKIIQSSPTREHILCVWVADHRPQKIRNLIPDGDQLTIREHTKNRRAAVPFQHKVEHFSPTDRRKTCVNVRIKH